MGKGPPRVIGIRGLGAERGDAGAAEEGTAVIDDHSQERRPGAQDRQPAQRPVLPEEEQAQSQDKRRVGAPLDQPQRQGAGDQRDRVPPPVPPPQGGDTGEEIQRRHVAGRVIGNRRQIHGAHRHAGEHRDRHGQDIRHLPERQSDHRHPAGHAAEPGQEDGGDQVQGQQPGNQDAQDIRRVAPGAEFPVGGAVPGEGNRLTAALQRPEKISRRVRVAAAGGLEEGLIRILKHIGEEVHVPLPDHQEPFRIRLHPQQHVRVVIGRHEVHMEIVNVPGRKQQHVHQALDQDHQNRLPPAPFPPPSPQEDQGQPGHDQGRGVIRPAGGGGLPGRTGLIRNPADHDQDTGRQRQQHHRQAGFFPVDPRCAHTVLSPVFFLPALAGPRRILPDCVRDGRDGRTAPVSSAGFPASPAGTESRRSGTGAGPSAPHRSGPGNSR